VPPGTPSSGYYSPHSSHPPPTPGGGATPSLGIASSFGSHHHVFIPYYIHTILLFIFKDIIKIIQIF